MAKRQLEDLTSELRDILTPAEPKRLKKERAKRAPRRSTARSELVKKLRAEKKVLKIKLRGVESDLRSLGASRKKKASTPLFARF